MIDEPSVTWVMGSELVSIWRSMSPDKTYETKKISDPPETFLEPRVTPKQNDNPTKSLIGCGKTSGSSICIFNISKQTSLM